MATTLPLHVRLPAIISHGQLWHCTASHVGSRRLVEIRVPTKLFRHQTYIVRAAGEDDLEPNPLPEESYWDKEEGRRKLNEIEEMKELIAEAEKLQNSVEDGKSIGFNKAEKLQEELARRAKEQTERRKQAEKMFDMGQRAYGRGMYDKSVEFLEGALTNVPAMSILGGQIQIWLAMAYDAHNRHDDCIALYKRLENTHPITEIRKQAAGLRYILEAPKLKISKDEMVSIPLLDAEYGSSDRTWSQMVREGKKRRYKAATSQSRDYLEDWLVWRPARWERSPYFWVAVTVWLTLVGISLMFQE